MLYTNVILNTAKSHTQTLTKTLSSLKIMLDINHRQQMAEGNRFIYIFCIKYIFILLHSYNNIFFCLNKINKVHPNIGSSFEATVTIINKACSKKKTLLIICVKIINRLSILPEFFYLFRRNNLMINFFFEEIETRVIGLNYKSNPCQTRPFS